MSSFENPYLQQAREREQARLRGEAERAARAEDDRLRAAAVAQSKQEFSHSGAGGACFNISTTVRGGLEEAQRSVRSFAHVEPISPPPIPASAFTAEQQAVIRAAVLEDRARVLAELRSERAAEADALARQIVAAADRYEGKGSGPMPTSFSFAEAAPEPHFTNVEQAVAAILAAADRGAGLVESDGASDEVEALAAMIRNAGQER